MGRIRKLTDKEVKELRELYASGKYTQKELAIRYKIHHSFAAKVINHKFYKHV